MDNQNANNGGFPQSPNPPQDNSQQPPTPAQGQAPMSGPNPNDNMENLRTQSVVESARDVAEKELAAQEAYNAQILKNQQAAIRRDKEMHIAVKIALIIFGILIFAALIWLVVQIVISATPQKPNECLNEDGTVNSSCCDRPEYKDNAACKEANDPYPTVDGYKCNSDKHCRKMTDIIKDELIIVKDTKYYLYDIKKATATPTTIDNSIDYNEMTSFEWGKGAYYVILEPNTGQYGLYSVKDNTQVIPNSVTRYYTDIKHKAYSQMTDVLGKYIIVRESSQYRLYNIVDGTKIAGGANGVFVHKNYVIGYENDNIRRVYNLNGTQVLLAKEGEELYEREGYLFSYGKTLAGVDKNGTKQTQSKNAIMKEINHVKKADRLKYLNNTKNKFYHMPLTRDYTDATTN